MIDQLRRVLDQAWILVILLLALGLRMYQLGDQSLWLDEAHTWWFARLPWDSSLDSLRVVGVHPPLHFIGIKMGLGLLGESEWGLRLLSAFVDVLAVALAVKIGREAGRHAGGITGGWFWAFHPMAIWYAREARPYALAAALAAAAVAVFVVLRHRSLGMSWGFAFAVLTLGLLSHYFFFLVGSALILFALADLRYHPGFFRRWMLVSLVAVVPLGLWLIWYFQQRQPVLGIGWIQRPVWTDVAGTFWNLLSGYGGVFSLPTTVLGLTATLLAAMGVLRGQETRLVPFSLWFGLILPLGVVWLISQIRPIYVDRYFIVLLPFVVLLIGSGAQLIWNKVADSIRLHRSGIAAGGAMLVLGAIGIWTGWQVHVDGTYVREDWRGLAGFLIRQAGEDPALWLSDAESIVPLRYYYHSDLRLLDSAKPLLCRASCWYVLRQPYTATHAFSQSVSLAERPWLPDVPDECHVTTRWQSTTGLALWKVQCNTDK